ncbi:hypothetical protein L1887_40666 [Cichorium endivia]|nr:hypothetical protein L1887_40666 [Cichorium endivia]
MFMVRRLMSLTVKPLNYMLGPKILHITYQISLFLSSKTIEFINFVFTFRSKTTVDTRMYMHKSIRVQKFIN